MPAPASVSTKPEVRLARARAMPAGHTPTMPFEPPVTSSHCMAIDHTICAKLSVSIAM